MHLPTTDLDAEIERALNVPVHPDRIALVTEHPHYPGCLHFDVGDQDNRQEFFKTYSKWMSRHLVLNELFLLDQFLAKLTEDHWYVIFDESTRGVLEDHARWSKPLAVPGYTLLDYQNFSLQKALERHVTGRSGNEERFFFWNWSAGAGKAGPITEPVLTQDGWRTMGDLHPGDRVIGSTGQPTRVVAIHPQGVRPVFRVEFNDGTFVRCNSEHLWNVRKYSTRTRRATSSDPTRKTRIEEAPWKTLTTREIKRGIEHGPYTRRWQTPPLSESIAFAPADPLPLDPYALGVILGDGCTSTGSWSVCTDREIVESLGWKVRPSGGRGDYTVTAGVPSEARETITNLGLAEKLSYQKFVPQQYLTAAPEDRLALLQGLLDTDGHAYGTKTGVEFSTTSPELRDGIADLVRGLRGRATISPSRVTKYTASDGSRVPGRESWRVSAVFPEDVTPFRLARKRDSYLPPAQRKIPHKIITAVLDEGVSEEQVCITVEAEDGLYVTRGHAITHNSFCSGAGIKMLQDYESLGMGVDLVIACTTSDLVINLFRFLESGGIDVKIAKGDRTRRRKIYLQETPHCLVMNFEKLRVDYDELAELTKGKRVLFILDEAQKLIAESGQNKARAALDKLTKACEATVWPMTATAVGASPLRYRDVFALDGHARKNALGTKAEFEERYAKSKKTRMINSRHGGAFPVTNYEWDHSELQDVRHRIHDRTMAVRRQSNMPTIPILVQASAGQREAFDVITQKAREAVLERDEDPSPYYRLLRMVAVTPAALSVTTDEIAAEINAEHPHLAQASAPKVELLNEMLEGIAEQEDQAVCFVHWTTGGLHLISPQLAVKHVKHWGTGQSRTQSQKAVDDFKSDPSITAFFSSDAGALGLSFQNARYVINVDPVYDYDLLTQRNKRIDRADSTLEGLTSYVLITEDSVEERLWHVCDARRRLSAATQGTAEELTPEDLDLAERPEDVSMRWMLFGS